MELNFITFSFYKAVLNNQQIKGPKGHPSIAYLRIACCTFCLGGWGNLYCN